MQRQMQHMARLIDDLLDVSRITRGVVRLRQERVELAAGRRGGAGGDPAARRGAPPGADARPCRPSRSGSTADPTRLEQVVGNLLQQRRQVHARRAAISA